MNCIITAGPTYEPLDNVRRLTNFSTGQLGCELAAWLTRKGHHVTLLIGEHATYPGTRRARAVKVFTTTADLRSQLKDFSRLKVHAVFHAAAVSDFTFGPVWFRSSAGKLTRVNERKISTRQSGGALLAELLPTSKIIHQLRRWYPKSLLVGWKFEVDGDRASVLRRAENQISESRTDACVANGPAYGKGFGLILREIPSTHHSSKPALFKALNQLLVSKSD